MADTTRRLYVAGSGGAGGLEPDLLGRIVDPHVNLDTPEGKYSLPVSVLATFQHEIIIKDIVDQVKAYIDEKFLEVFGAAETQENPAQLSLDL
jgi:hypothetical protein